MTAPGRAVGCPRLAVRQPAAGAVDRCAANRAAARDTARRATQPPAGDRPATAGTRNGREIYERFRDRPGRPELRAADASTRWRQHFAAAPKRLAAGNDDLLPLFGYVVDALRAASLPTEFALIPLVESGYQPGARSPAGPAGMWQMIAHHRAQPRRADPRLRRPPVAGGLDPRRGALPEDPARHVRRRLAAGVMAYNAGEYRIARRAQAQRPDRAATPSPSKPAGLSGITHAYVAQAAGAVVPDRAGR